jgi:hypothetical protein
MFETKLKMRDWKTVSRRPIAAAGVFCGLPIGDI